MIRPLGAKVRRMSAIIRPFSPLIRPMNAIICPFAAMIRPMNAIIRPFAALIRPMNAIIRPFAPPFRPPNAPFFPNPEKMRSEFGKRSSDSGNESSPLRNQRHFSRSTARIRPVTAVFPRNRAVSAVASTSFPETTPELAATAPLFRVYHSPE